MPDREAWLAWLIKVGVILCSSVRESSHHGLSSRWRRKCRPGSGSSGRVWGFDRLLLLETVKDLH
jgi:hypothetical protein